MNAPALCYVLPKLDVSTGEHLAHTYRLIEEVAARIDVAVIAERGSRGLSLGRAEVHVQRRRTPPLRLLELIGILRQVRRRGCRTFFVRYSYFGVFAAWIVTRLLGGEVYYWHCTSKTFRTPGWSASAIRQRLRAEMPLLGALRMADFLVTGTAAVGQFYQRAFGLSESQIRIVANDIEPRWYEPRPDARLAIRTRYGIPAGDHVVLFVHRIVQRKGAHYLPDIARRVWAAEADTTFLIVGEGPLLGWLREQLTADSSPAPRAVLVGSVPNAEIADFYAAADVLLMPSEEEGFPRVLLEAMSAGLPFVASDVGGVRDICTFEQAKHITRVGDVAQCADFLIALLRDAAERNRLAHVGRERVRRYATPKVVVEMLQALGLEGRTR